MSIQNPLSETPAAGNIKIISLKGGQEGGQRRTAVRGGRVVPAGAGVAFARSTPRERGEVV